MLFDSEAGGIAKSNHGCWTVHRGKILKVPSIKHQPEIACLKIKKSYCKLYESLYNFF